MLVLCAACAALESGEAKRGKRGERKREEMMRSGLKTERASVFGIAVVEFRRELLTLSLALSLFKSRPREKGRRGPGLRKGK